jgi:hypothetical protein
MKSPKNRFFPLVVGIIFVLLASTGCSSKQDPTSQQVEAINVLRTQLELPKKPLEFVETSIYSNSPRGDLQVAVYQDSEGRKFYVDPLTNQVVEMDARPLLENISPLASSLSDNDLWAKAHQFIAAVIPDFETLQTGWMYEAGNKGDNYFYVWSGKMAPGETNLPRAQIALHRSGLLFGYTNTLLLDK